jgi:hypothetical protein
MSYEPKPIDTSHIELPPALEQLTERLAENAHDLWARQRFADGWTHGPQRDDKAKQHPCLVAYADLPESEKRYDREAAIGTLKAILSLGYAIHPPE